MKSKLSINDVKKTITAYLTGEFAKFPVVVCKSPEDSTTLWVQVFCVTPDQKNLVKEKIFAAQETFFPAAEIMLLPMVKSLAITEQYYPEYLPKVPNAYLIKEPIDLLKGVSDSAPKWKSLTTPSNCTKPRCLQKAAMAGKCP